MDRGERTGKRKDSRRVNHFSTAIILITIGYLAVVGFFESSTVANMATVEAISLGIYWDTDCSREARSIDWGSLYPGSSETADMYVRNEGDAVARLSLTATDWQPPGASEPIRLDWDYTGQEVHPDDVIPVALRLSLSSDMKGITTFYFNIVISAEDVPLLPPPPPPRPPPPPPPPPDVTPPRVSITNPESGAVVNGSNLLVRWVGSDSGSGIDCYSVYLNEELKLETKSDSCELSMLTEGSNNVTVRARDKAGNIAEDGITVIVDNTPPVASMSCPEGDKVRGTVTINFSVSDDNLAKIRLQIGDDVVDVTGNNSYPWDTLGVSDGTHTIKVTAIDEAGNTNSSSVSILVDNTEPVLSLVGLEDGTVVTGSVAVRFSVFDITSVSAIYALNDEAPVDITGRASINMNATELEDGVHIMRFVVTDALGNSAENAVRIVVDNTLPSLDFDTPINGSHLRDTASIVLAGNDANFDWMELHVPGEVAERWHTGGPREYGWDTLNCDDGACIVKAVVCDKAGNIVEESLIVSIDNTAPNVSIISPPRKRSVAGMYTVEFSASDVNLAEVFLHIDGGVFNVTGANSYTWNTIGVNDGEHMVKIRALDKAGNVGEMEITVRTISQYLILESVTGIVFLAFIIYIWPRIMMSKHLVI